MVSYGLMAERKNNMSKFDEMITQMKSVEYAEKRQFLQYFAQMAERAKHQIGPEEKAALLNFAYEEADAMLLAIPEAPNYREKDLIFQCEDFLMGIVMHLTGSAANLPEDKLMKLKALAELVNRERRIETTLDELFSQNTVTEMDMNRLLYWVRSSTDEYQKSRLFLGLVHYQKDIGKLEDGAKRMLTDYIASELPRLMELKTQDALEALELIADVSKHFADPRVLSSLTDLTQLGSSHINFYAVGSLCALGVEVPQPVIDALARDLEYAAMTYHLLQQHGKANQFPAECTGEEYLAKSDLVRWLNYPTELGKSPDEIVYLGRIKPLFKKEVFHVFKFRSDSDTLGEELKNKWLIGWSSNEGGTFSNFDEFAPYEQEPIEKALKKIKKQLIG